MADEFSFFFGRGGSGQIRGAQISTYLRDKCGLRVHQNPALYEGTCIFVKMQPHDNYPLGSYFDIMDAPYRMEWLQHHPDIGVIAFSLSAQNYLKMVLNRPVVYIPQHHCNFERRVHEWEGTRVGVVGHWNSITDAVRSVMDVTQITKCRAREDCVAGYEQIDIQVCWRTSEWELKNPLKVINAASFGIPTVAFPNPTLAEVEGYYYPAHSIDELVAQVACLKREGWDRQRLIDMAEAYHIEHIAQRYGVL